MSNPAILTTVVGSYPLPAWLAAMPSQTAVRDAMLVVLKTQELAGIDVIADGELSRFDVDHPETNGMIDSFIGPMSGIDSTLSYDQRKAFRAQESMGFRRLPAGVVTGPIGSGQLDLYDDWQMIRGLTNHPLKFTFTSPYMLGRTLLDQHYGDLKSLTMALAEILAEQAATIDAAVIQVDEANLTGNPADASWAHEPINVVLEAITGKRGMHLCFGNYGGSSIQSGFWADLLPFLNNLKLDHLVLEFARRGFDELDAFKELRPEIHLGIGVIDIKDNEVESPELVASRIERSVKVLGADRIKWVHPDCGFWMLPRSVADGKITALVEGRDLYEGRA
jgi:5-methyltetrahydropteroyltriglutamate--homocysteine methyltransferase